MYFVFAKDNDPSFKGSRQLPNRQVNSAGYRLRGGGRVVGSSRSALVSLLCFTGWFADRFIKSLDLSPSGIISVVREVNSLLQQVDFQLWSHLVRR
jgi:hypothetical protein